LAPLNEMVYLLYSWQSLENAEGKLDFASEGLHDVSKFWRSYVGRDVSGVMVTFD
jgi:hypothetical protein